MKLKFKGYVCREWRIVPQGRSYGSGVHAALASLSRGSCYWPDCGEPVVRFVQGVPVANLQIAHIYAFEKGGPRHKESMSTEEKNSFSNLILLCHPHHVLVDKRFPEKFPPVLLFKWKERREADGQEKLSGLRNVTEDRLQELISSVIARQGKRIEDAISKLENFDSEAAAVVRELLDEVNQLRRSSSFVDPDAINTLYKASANLKGYLDPDSINTLMKASENLKQSNMSALIEQLAAFGREARRIQGFM